MFSLLCQNGARWIYNEFKCRIITNNRKHKKRGLRHRVRRKPKEAEKRVGIKSPRKLKGTFGNRIIMTGPKGNSEFCFPEALNI